MVPLTVTAHLRSGLSYDPPFGLDLAGLLAAEHRTRVKATLEAEGSLVTTPLPDTTEEEADDYPLPLQKCTLGDDWHWAASCVFLSPVGPDMEPRPYTRTVDVPWAAAAADLPLPWFNSGKGAYRDARMPAPVTPAATATWWAVGDATQVLSLLTPVISIGRRRHVGEGVVLSWDVIEHPDEDPTVWAHLGPGDLLHRPVPSGCADHLGIVETRECWYAIRPPSWHPDRLQQLVASADPEDW